MKERMFDLTARPTPSTLEVRGDIFMPDGAGTGEGEQITQNPDISKRVQEKRSNPTETRLLRDEEQTKRIIEESVKTGERLMAGASDTDPNEKIEGTPEDNKTPEVRTGRAIWRSGGEDQEVNVISSTWKGPDESDFVIITNKDGLTIRVPFRDIKYLQERTSEEVMPEQEGPQQEALVAAAGAGGEGGEPPPGGRRPTTEETPSEEPEDNTGDELGRKPELVDVGAYSDTLLSGMTITKEDAEDRYVLQEISGEIRDLIKDRKVDLQEARQLLRRVTELQRKLYEDDFRGFYLQEADKKMLREDKGPQHWLDLQFDILYDLTQEGQELTSTMISNMQTLTQEASRYITLQKKDRPTAKEFEAKFNNRLFLIQMRTAMTYKDIESVKGAAFKLGTHGLLYGLGQEDGRVESMFNRLQELAQTERLRQPEFHLTPAVVSQLQERLIAEQVELAEKGGLFEGKTEADIRRSVRMAYDILVSSQRLGVIVARGKHLRGDEAYFSDPIGPLNIYNFEEFLTAKFGVFNLEQQEFLRALKLEIADYNIKEGKIKGITNIHEKEEYGAKLLRDLFKVPDIFTSSWRVQGMMEALEERLGEEKAGDFALFMRLRDARLRDERFYTEKEAKIEVDNIWKKIEKYKADEVIGMVREADPQRLRSLNSELYVIDNSLEPSATEIRGGITFYDKFKEKYGPAIRLLREKGLSQNDPRQIDFANLNNWDKGVINRAMGGDIGAGDRVQEIFKSMQGFITRENITIDIRNDHKYAGMLERTVVVDDALLHRMEQSDGGHTPISKKYSNEPGGDSLVRSWNDHENAKKAMEGLIAFVKHGENFEQNQKDAQAFAEAIAQYNGEEEKARAYRFTRGTYLQLALQNIFVDGMGLKKLPFRINTSEIQRIFGPEVKTISRDEGRKILDHEKSLFVGNVGIDKLHDENAKAKAEKLFRNIELELDATLDGAIKRRSISIVTFLIAWIGIEINEFRKNVMNAKA